MLISAETLEKVLTSCLVSWSAGSPVCGFSQRPQRPWSGLPDSQLPDPNGTQNRGDGSDGRGWKLRSELRDVRAPCSSFSCCKDATMKEEKRLLGVTQEVFCFCCWADDGCVCFQKKHFYIFERWFCKIWVASSGWVRLRSREFISDVRSDEVVKSFYWNKCSAMIYLFIHALWTGYFLPCSTHAAGNSPDTLNYWKY